jgi:hypothetical protein
MTKRSQRDQKTEELKQTGTLNPHAETVTDPLFQQNLFFDPRDLLQTRLRDAATPRRRTDVDSRFSMPLPLLAFRAPRFIRPKYLSNDLDWPAYCRLGGGRRVVTS